MNAREQDGSVPELLANALRSGAPATFTSEQIWAVISTIRKNETARAVVRRQDSAVGPTGRLALEVALA